MLITGSMRLICSYVHIYLMQIVCLTLTYWKIQVLNFLSRLSMYINISQVIFRFIQANQASVIKE